MLKKSGYKFKREWAGGYKRGFECRKGSKICVIML